MIRIPITLQKEKGIDHEGHDIMKCGFKIGGGIDQDFRRSPQGYTDNGIYVTEVHEGSPASKAGLQIHDKILQMVLRVGIIFPVAITDSLSANMILVFTTSKGVVTAAAIPPASECIGAEPRAAGPMPP
ncbi:unnamed protein product [Darwinula stevensoni]|uniref:PDZ domain-containing protein n=1 Tax=Darwinula stevensoni TaxID=69355 RepID=A0A7R8XDE1_9CRUS|nr:unnamed protein product [Darwinula stevensoni]CAG0888578.1 unnamed protein product [Darwinula stevensoni]